MKTLFHNPLLHILFLLSLLFSCKKADCPDYACQNGGTCFEGSCMCPEGFSGPDCSEALLTPLLLTKVVVTRFPALRLSGEQWDGGWGTLPDIYIALAYKGNILYAYPDDYSHADYNQEYTFDIPAGDAVLFEPDQAYKIALYDRDSYTDDLIGEFSFVPYDYIGRDATFPVTITMDNGGRVAFKATLREY